MKRNESVDSIAGIMILYMVFTHVCQHYHWEHATLYIVMEHLLYFFMPWFFFKAGMFFKIGNNNDVFIRSTKRLLKPFILYSLIGHLCYCFLIYMKGELTISEFIPYKSLLLTGSVPGNLPLWFLLTLFGCRVIFNFILSKNIPVVVVALASLIVAFFLHVIGFNYPYYIANIMTGLFFMSLGYIQARQNANTPPILALGIIIYVLSLFYPSFVGMRSNHLYYGFYLLWIFYSVSGIITMNLIGGYLFGKNTFLRNVGRYSMEIYCLHWIILIFL